MNAMKKAGFTLVEVILAITVGTLIAALAFYGITQAQRNQRDDSRRADAARYLVAVKDWISNNNGLLPSGQADLDTALKTYITNGGAYTFNAPAGGAAWVPTWASAGGAPSVGSAMYVYAPATCNAGQVVPGAGGSGRQVAVAVGLESNGSYCLAQ